MHLLCKKSSDCATGDVCDRKQHECRTSLRKAGPNKATFAKICLSKGIPIEYERGQKKGQRKSKEAMRQCKHQHDRNAAASYNPRNALALPAPSVKPASKVASASSPFVRPKEAELKGMRKDDLLRIYQKGQNKGYINPNKESAVLTNKQLANAILRANKKLN